MSMTARMVVMMTPQDKQAIEGRARAQKLTPSELMRRAARDYDPTPDEAVLTLIAEEIEGAAARMKKRLDDSYAYCEALRAETNALRVAHGHKPI